MFGSNTEDQWEEMLDSSIMQGGWPRQYLVLYKGHLGVVQHAHRQTRFTDAFSIDVVLFLCKINGKDKVQLINLQLRNRKG